MKLNGYLPQEKKMTLVFSYDGEDIGAVSIESKGELIFGHALQVVKEFLTRNGIDKKSTGIEMIDVGFHLGLAKSDLDSIVNYHPIFSKMTVKVTHL